MFSQSVNLRANLNSIAIAILTALVLWLGNWVWKTEQRITCLESQLHEATGTKVFWKLHTATWSEVNRIDRALNRPEFPWPLENFYSTPQ